MENLTTAVPNYTHIYFSYSTVTSACQGSWLACTLYPKCDLHYKIRIVLHRRTPTFYFIYWIQPCDVRLDCHKSLRKVARNY